MDSSTLTQDTLILEVRNELTHGDHIGHCKWFNNKLGYGFIRVCTGALKGTDIFVHHSGLRPLNSSFKTMYKGEYVHFNIVDGRNGKQAVDVTGIFGGPMMCDGISNRGSHAEPAHSRPYSGIAPPPGFPFPQYSAKPAAPLYTYAPYPQAPNPWSHTFKAVPHPMM